MPEAVLRSLLFCSSVQLLYGPLAGVVGQDDEAKVDVMLVAAKPRTELRDLSVLVQKLNIG